jgi:hypothetical protein
MRRPIINARSDDMATNNKKNFDEKAAPPAMVGVEAYQALLEKLVAEGRGMGKTKAIGGFVMQDIKIDTETDTGKIETSRYINVEKVCICMDPDWYQDEEKRRLIMERMVKLWGEKLTHVRPKDFPDFRGPGVWVNKESSVRGDYIIPDPDSETSSLFEPDPNATRVCLTITEPVNVRAPWGAGGFFIAKGGTLAIREKDLEALTETLASIRRGEKTAEEALLTQDDKGNTIARFDVYGMYPHFAEVNYDPVVLKPETVAIQDAQKVKNAGKSVKAAKASKQRP